MAIVRSFASSLFIVLIVALPYLRVNVRDLILDDLKKIRDALIYQEARYPVNRTRRAAVGFGSCWDLVTSGVALLEKAGISPPSSSRHFDTITSKEELAQVFAYFFENGAASERYMSDKESFDSLVSISKQINITNWSIGGNAPVMSQRLALEGWNVLLAAKVSQATVKALHKSMKFTITSSPDVREDIHLIMEYDIGDTWDRYVSPRANRFIVHNDYSNMMLESLEGFRQSLASFEPDLVIIGGLQLLDNFRYDHDIRTRKLKEVGDILSSLSRSVKIHFEMASFSEELLLRELLEYAIPYADSLGMNEQELANLYNLLVHGRVNLVSDYSPRIALALDQGRTVWRLLNERKSPNQRQLTRVHIHTLAYQAIFTVQDSGWVHTRSATAKASLMANRHVCSSQSINIGNAKLIMDESFSVSTEPGSRRVPLMEDTPVSCWYEENTKFCVAPNLICTAVHKTASAGDNISAAGLSIQL